MKYWVSEKYVSGAEKYLWHVWETGITHSICVDAFKDESCARDYCKEILYNLNSVIKDYLSTENNYFSY